MSGNELPKWWEIPIMILYLIWGAIKFFFKRMIGRQ